MLWIREEEVFPGSDYGAVVHGCGNLDLDSVSSDVRREDPEAPPPFFYHHLCLVLCLATSWGPLGGAQVRLAA